MKCINCGYDNPPQNSKCQMCGQVLVPADISAPPLTSPHNQQTRRAHTHSTTPLNKTVSLGQILSGKFNPSPTTNPSSTINGDLTINTDPTFDPDPSMSKTLPE